MITDLTTVPTWEGDIGTFVRSLLTLTPAELPDARILGQLNRLVATTFDDYPDPTGAGYAGLTGNDLLFFNEALGYLVAIRLFYVKYGGATGPVEQLQVSTFKFVYGKDSTDIRNTWADAARADFGFVTYLAALKVAENDWNPNTISGPSRDARGRRAFFGIVDTLLDVYENRNDQSLINT